VEEVGENWSRVLGNLGITVSADSVCCSSSHKVPFCGMKFGQSDASCAQWPITFSYTRSLCVGLVGRRYWRVYDVMGRFSFLTNMISIIYFCNLTGCWKTVLGSHCEPFFGEVHRMPYNAQSCFLLKLQRLLRRFAPRNDNFLTFSTPC
jgi:hypothetical protein